MIAPLGVVKAKYPSAVSQDGTYPARFLFYHGQQESLYSGRK
jgi:hypothetical protein